MTAAARSRRFLAFSSEVTAFTEFDLLGTGLAECYLSTVVRVVGEEILTELLDAFDHATRADGQDRQARKLAIDREVLSDFKLGPVARNIIKLWYVGVWYVLPAAWTESFGAREHDGTFTASAQGYPEGLLWRTIGANPPGAKAPGYGSWAYPPVIPPIPDGEPAAAAAVPAPRSAGQEQEAQAERAKETAQ